MTFHLKARFAPKSETANEVSAIIRGRAMRILGSLRFSGAR